MKAPTKAERKILRQQMAVLMGIDSSWKDDPVRLKKIKEIGKKLNIESKKKTVEPPMPVKVIYPDGSEECFNSFAEVTSLMGCSSETIWASIEQERPVKVGHAVGCRFERIKRNNRYGDDRIKIIWPDGTTRTAMTHQEAQRLAHCGNNAFKDSINNNRPVAKGAAKGVVFKMVKAKLEDLG